MKQMGLKCEDHPDGSKTCKRVKAKRSGIYGTGTDVELIPDPETCKVRESGTVMDEDRGAIDEKIKDMESKCKKGF